MSNFVLKKNGLKKFSLNHLPEKLLDNNLQTLSSVKLSNRSSVVATYNNTGSIIYSQLTTAHEIKSPTSPNGRGTLRVIDLL